jgi:multiple sugar transport system permease protein
MSGRRIGKRSVFYIIACAFAAVYLFPILWLLRASLITQKELFTISWTFSPTLYNFWQVFTDLGFGHYVLNSLLVTFTATVVSVACGSVAAYGLVRLDIKGGKWIAFLMLFTRFIPPVAVLVPFFVLISFLGLYDTHIALILAHISVLVPYVVFVMYGFFVSLPLEIEEAAIVDGCSMMQVFIKIVLPLSFPGLVAATIFAAITSWNDFIYALIITGYSSATWPIFFTQYTGEVTIKWTQIAAGAVIVALPVVILGTAMQKFVTKGLTFGAIR